MRLPNVFTAMADVAMGFLVTHGDLQPPLHFALLVVASCLLYLSGMVLNDVFDAEVDARERPERPDPLRPRLIASGDRTRLGFLASGTLIAWFASFLTHDWRPGTVASLLAICIVLYDRVLKRTPLAPLIMGACRSLNVLLGMSLAPLATAPLVTEVTSPYVRWGMSAAWLIALGIGLYIVGVTWFARSDARTSPRGQLIGGLAVLLAGMALLITVPGWSDHTPPLRVSTSGWHLLWAAIAVITARAACWPSPIRRPPKVQAAVRHCVQSIIVLDAALCVGYAGPHVGLRRVRPDGADDAAWPPGSKPRNKGTLLSPRNEGEVGSGSNTRDPPQLITLTGGSRGYSPTRYLAKQSHVHSVSSINSSTVRPNGSTTATAASRTGSSPPPAASI